MWPLNEWFYLSLIKQGNYTGTDYGIFPLYCRPSTVLLISIKANALWISKNLICVIYIHITESRVYSYRLKKLYGKTSFPFWLRCKSKGLSKRIHEEWLFREFPSLLTFKIDCRVRNYIYIWSVLYLSFYVRNLNYRRHLIIKNAFDITLFYSFKKNCYFVPYNVPEICMAAVRRLGEKSQKSRSSSAILNRKKHHRSLNTKYLYFIDL